MNQTSRTNSIPGTTAEEERRMLADILAIADDNLKRTKESVQNLANELHELKEVYDAEDKEGLAQWFNTDARFKQVSQELLRAERSRRKPYFGRIDFTDAGLLKEECYYIGKSVIARDAAEPEVIDWRAPIASVYYEKALGKCTYSVKGEGAFEIDLSGKRTYEIENDELKDFYDSDVVANDELLTKYLARNKKAVLSEIIATIQQEQNEIIRKKPQHNVIVQGGAGSGKTTVAMHRISYILYNYDLEFKPKDFYIIGSNRILLNYITGILPDLDVYGVSQMTMEQLFIRLLYEDWDGRRYSVKSLDRGDETACVKGSLSWFHDLEGFCERYEWNYIPREDIIIEKTARLLMSRAAIEKLLKKFRFLSLAEKKEKLTEHLMAKLENEIYGKYYSYPPEEQKALLRYYQTYFGRQEWKGSIFELYDDFLREQNAEESHVVLPGTAFDLYDLAALAYLYKRIKETEVIQEASHVVIDEAQDFGMMAYGALKYCLSKCTYTIMGDVSQNIYFNYGLTDWEELRRLMLPDEFDYFGLLRKSYRNTVEISDFATNILLHGNFPVYPTEPIIRHGNAVRITGCTGETELITEAAGIISRWKEMGYETIAVICREEAEADKVTEQLQKKVKLRDFRAETEEFGSGVMVLPIEYSKGLEFDAVLLYNANDRNYPAADGYTKLLYVAATRALHELAVLYAGRLTDLIAAPVPAEKKLQAITVQPKKSARRMPEEEPKTNREIEAERALEGQREMELRNRIGPKRIVTQTSQAGKTTEGVPKKSDTISPIGRKVDYYASLRTKQEEALRSMERRNMPDRNASDRNTPDRNAPDKNTPARRKKGADHIEFGGMPDMASLRPLGHSKFNLSVRWVSRGTDFIELTNAYGILRITPISDNTVRISFAREQLEKLPDIPAELATSLRPGWSYRESKDSVELTTGKLLLRADKKTGALSFYTAKEKLLLAENSQFPRQVEKAPQNQTWTYFNWGKKEILKARGTADGEWLALHATARIISFGAESERPACLMSNNGYQILLPADGRVICCTIPAYGAYLHTDKMQTDYFFRTAL